MRKLLLSAMFGALLLTGCVMYATPGRGGVMVVPPLPAIVELDVEPFYFYNGFYYYYHPDQRWTYSRSKRGPWKDLPPGHYPKETKWKRGKPGRW